MSVGRQIDEQHCFFGGHVLHPNIAIEYDSASPLGPNRPLVSGPLALKQRMFAHFNVRTATIHDIFWKSLTDEQKDEQIIRLRTQLGYVHQRDLESTNQYAKTNY
jgi:hypothetical protein